VKQIMKSNFKILIFTFSIILNLAFLGATVFYKLSSYAATDRRPGANHPFLYQKLNLSREQISKIEPLRDKFQAQLEKLGDEIKTKQLELVDLLAAPGPDRKAIDAVRERIDELQKTTQITIISHIDQDVAIFTPQQRQRFFGLMKERIKQNSVSCPPWMRPSQGARMFMNK
jgi:Spy/CpxP family protein refolding chaperone